MKKIISLIATIAIAVTFVSCNPNSQPKSNPYVESAKKYGYYHIFNVSYGMLFDECLDALGVTEDEVKVLTPEELGNDPDNLLQQGFAIDTTLYNKNIIAIFNFDNYLHKSGYSLGLYEIKLTFKDHITLDELTAEIENDLAQKDISFDIGTNLTGGPSYDNSKTINSIEDEKIRNDVSNLANDMFYDWMPDKTSSKTIDQYRLDRIWVMINPDTDDIYYVSISSKLATAIGIVDNRYN